MSHSDNVPETIEASIDTSTVTPIEKKINDLKLKILDLVQDAAEVVHCAIKDEKYRGKKVSRTQLYAANPSVARFAPALEGSANGEVHLHLNLPRPKKENIIQVKAKEVK